jgi:rhomboid protease GluP
MNYTYAPLQKNINLDPEADSPQQQLSPAKPSIFLGFQDSWLLSKLNFRSVTLWIIIIQIGMFLLCLMTYYATGKKWSCVLYMVGANYLPSVISFNHWYRYLVPQFLHLNTMHILMNSLAQVTFCFSLEESLGKVQFLMIYLGAGMGGMLFSNAVHGDTILVGASCAIFGAIGFELTYVLENYNDLGPRKLNYLVMLLMYVFNGLNAENTHVDFYGHMGGFIMGVLLSFLYLKNQYYCGFENDMVKKMVTVGIVLWILALILKIYAEYDKTMMKRALGMENCQ